MMMHGRNSGKKLMAVRIVRHAMEIIHLLTDANPIQILVDAVINSGPREDATRIGSAGVVRRQVRNGDIYNANLILKTIILVHYQPKYARMRVVYAEAPPQQGVVAFVMQPAVREGALLNWGRAGCACRAAVYWLVQVSRIPPPFPISTSS